jgi:CubicO group peptidase (beta-lactamase class C family)
MEPQPTWEALTELDLGALLDDLADSAAVEADRWGVPGWAIGLASPGSVATRGFGLADPMRGRPVAPTTLFRVCSVTKPFTATLVMSLVESGPLDLDEPVCHVVQALRLADPGALATLSLRHLLTHTSGLECELPTDLARYGADDLALDRIIGDFPLLRQWLAPGTAFGYANSGYWLAGAAVARAAAVPYEAAMTERVLEPLGLRRTLFSPRRPSDPDLALPHASVDGRRDEPPAERGFDFPRGRAPSGGLVSSAADLARFAAFHLEPAVPGPVSYETRLLMRTPAVSRGITGRWQALGWRVKERAGDLVVGHDGGCDGYRSMVCLVPRRQVGLAVLTNSDDGWRLTRRVLERLLERLLGPAPVGAVVPEPVPIAQLDRLAGVYSHPDEPTGHTTITASGGQLQLAASATETTTSVWQPVSGLEFVPIDDSGSEDRLTFVLDSAGTPIVARIDNRLCGRLDRAPARHPSGLTVDVTRWDA